MKRLLVALNAKFTHTNLAVRCIAAYGRAHYQLESEYVEFTINQYTDYIVERLYSMQPDLLCFSCYIWNIEQVRDIIAQYKLISPETIIIAGGPEVSFEWEEFLKENPFVDYLVLGEGEDSLNRLFYSLEQGEIQIDKLPGIVFHQKGQFYKGPTANPVDLALLPFPYKGELLPEHRILYYESSRGCPFRCQYCLSGGEGRVRLRPLELVLPELQVFLDQKVPQVKFVDRTFNCDKRHAMEIWNYLKEHDNGITNFHFEITASLLNREMLQFLKTVRKEQFQFEIGVQSTNAQTLQAICRAEDFNQLSETVREINSGQNIHQHLDLIAGLPFEDLSSFEHSFCDVIALRPEQLQLGFLKLLKGSGLRKKAEEYGIRYSTKAPYQALCTNWLTPGEMFRLHHLEEMVETYYNSGRFNTAISFLLKQFSSPYRFFDGLAEFFYARGYSGAKFPKEELYTILCNYTEEQFGQLPPELPFLCLFDAILHEKPRKLPEWMYHVPTEHEKAVSAAVFRDQELMKQLLSEYSEESPSKLSRLAHLEFLPIHPLTLKWDVTPVLVNYRRRGIDGRAAYFIVNTDKYHQTCDSEQQ